MSVLKMAYNVEAFMKLWYLENFTLAHAHSQIDAISLAFNVKPQFYKCTVGCCTAN